MTARHAFRDPVRVKLWDTFWLWREGEPLRNAWRMCSARAGRRQHPAPRDWGESRLPSAADRTAQFDAIGERVMPGRRDGLGHADLDQFLPPWEDAAVPVTPEPPLPPLPGPEYLTAPVATHAPPDVARGRVHAGCEISDTGQQAALDVLRQRLQIPLAESDRAICLCGKVPDIPGEPITSEAGCPAHGTELPPAGAAGLGTRPGEDDTRMCRDCASGYCGRAMCKPDDDCACPCSTWAKPLNCPCCVDGDALRCCICERNCGSSECRCRPAPDDTVTDMRPVPAPVAARENAAARWSLRAHVSHVIAWKPPLRAWVDDVIGTSPAEDWDRLAEKVRAGAVSDGG